MRKEVESGVRQTQVQSPGPPDFNWVTVGSCLPSLGLCFPVCRTEILPPKQAGCKTYRQHINPLKNYFLRGSSGLVLVDTS